jgi:hypothetical protein|eukprot:122985_1
MIIENQPIHQHHLADLESIPNQIGHAIINSKDGALLHPPSGSLSHHDIDLLYQILLEVGETMKEDGNSASTGTSGDKLKKVTIEGGDALYSMCATTDGFVYVVKRRSIRDH